MSLLNIIPCQQLIIRKDATVVESADTRDLKSLGYYGHPGSSPGGGTKEDYVIT